VRLIGKSLAQLVGDLLRAPAFVQKRGNDTPKLDIDKQPSAPPTSDALQCETLSRPG
jgi:hypothetical protein